MVSSSLVPLIAAACFLTSALGHARGWRLAMWFAATGAALLAGALAGRGIRSGNWPLTSEHGFVLAFSLSTTLAALALCRGLDAQVRAVRAATMGLAAVLAGYAALGIPDSTGLLEPLPSVLASFWLPLHAGLAALAYGALAVAGLAGLIWLVRPSDRVEAAWLVNRAAMAGYPLLTLSLLFGMFWAHAAWGPYWGWSQKEVWTLNVWLLFTLLWHLRRRPSWAGRRLAWLALTGLGAELFTLLGVGWLARAVAL